MTVTKTIAEDWRYSELRLNLREQALHILLRKYGSHMDDKGAPLVSMKGIYECAHDWVSQGNVSCSGLVKYYEAYYKNEPV